MHSKGTSSGYNNPKMDELLDGARGETDAKKREGMYHQIVDLTLDDCPLIYHVNVTNIQLHSAKLTGFTPTPQEYVERLHTISWS
jgi:peptide/nickel transport system substrate-binding protein